MIAGESSWAKRRKKLLQKLRKRSQKRRLNHSRELPRLTTTISSPDAKRIWICSRLMLVMTIQTALSLSTTSRKKVSWSKSLRKLNSHKHNRSWAVEIHNKKLRLSVATRSTRNSNTIKSKPVPTKGQLLPHPSSALSSSLVMWPSVQRRTQPSDIIRARPPAKESQVRRAVAG